MLAFTIQHTKTHWIKPNDSECFHASKIWVWFFLIWLDDCFAQSQKKYAHTKCIAASFFFYRSFDDQIKTSVKFVVCIARAPFTFTNGSALWNWFPFRFDNHNRISCPCTPTRYHHVSHLTSLSLSLTHLQCLWNNHSIQTNKQLNVPNTWTSVYTVGWCNQRTHSVNDVVQRWNRCKYIS